MMLIPPRSSSSHPVPSARAVQAAGVGARRAPSLPLLGALTLTFAACQSGAASSAPGSASAPRTEAAAAAPDLATELAEAPGHILLVDDAGERSQLIVTDPTGAPAPAPPTLEGVDLFPADGAGNLAIATWGGEDDHQEQLVVLGADGAWRRVGPAASKVRNPSLSPDGTWVAVESDRESFRDIYRIELATGETTRLTRDDDGAFDPAVAPDGRQIAFVTTTTADAEVHIMAADGSERRRLIDQPGHEHTPRWSPDGGRLVYVGDRDGGERLFIADADGGAATRMTTLEDADRHEADPVWSPNGRLVAYLVHHATGPRELWVVDATTGRSLRISPAMAHVEHVSWSPDSRHLVYGDDTEDGRAVLVARADGSERRQLVPAARRAWLPRWRP